MRSKRLIIAAFFCLVTANAIPAFRLAGDEVFGFMASYLQFFAVLASDLEPGQRPAAALGIIANFGFLATFFALLIGPRRLAKRIATVAAISAFGSVTSLAMGIEHFVPYPGCVLWLATGVLLVIASSASSQMTLNPTLNPTRKRPRILNFWWLGGTFIFISIVAWLGARLFYQSNLRKIDERIVAEVEASLTTDLHALTVESEISQRYGKFKELTNVRWWDRPPIMLQTERRRDLEATAHFENAKAQIFLSIGEGSSLATSLEMSPSEKWRREHPESAGELVLIDGELWQNGGAHCRIDGWATHPEFLSE